VVNQSTFLPLLHGMPRTQVVLVNWHPMGRYRFVSAHFVLVNGTTSYKQCRFLVWSVYGDNQSFSDHHRAQRVR
jgi:hypothetical protein